MKFRDFPNFENVEGETGTTKCSQVRVSYAGDSDDANPTLIRSSLRASFIRQWNNEWVENKKLGPGFYNSIKADFGCEKYLSLKLSHQQSRRLAQLRTSSHRYNIETGRHGLHRRNNIIHRVCFQCTTNDMDTMEAMAALPCFDPIIEDEVHVLRTCTLYEDLRHNLSQRAKTCLFADLASLFTE